MVIVTLIYVVYDMIAVTIPCYGSTVPIPDTIMIIPSIFHVSMDIQPVGTVRYNYTQDRIMSIVRHYSCTILSTRINMISRRKFQSLYSNRG